MQGATTSCTTKAKALATPAAAEKLVNGRVHVDPKTTTVTTTPRYTSTPELTPRNQAPGIPDRRKSLRPGASIARGGRPSRGSNSKSSGIALRISSVGGMAEEPKVHDDEQDKVDHDDEKTDTFQDAESNTPRPTSTEPDANVGATAEPIGVPGDDVSLSPPTDSAPTSPGKLPSHSRQNSTSPVRHLRGLSGDVTAPVLPPPSTSERIHNLERRESRERIVSAPPQPGNFARKASSQFGALFGRMGNMRKPAKSPVRSERSPMDRRDTAASTASDTLATIHHGKPSLQDQFSSLRRQEEFSAHDVNGNALHELDENSGTFSDAASRPTSPSKQNGRSPSFSAALKSPTLNPSLPPGTASGISVGPAQDPKEVNWDLWQQVVYEGPAAVARTSGTELREAVTSGIPPAIRGVVWQVLAESNNEELDGIYRLLKARGTESESRPAASRAESTVGGDKDVVTSDASSEHSARSTAADSGAASPPTSIESTAPNLLAEKQKRDAAALQKLEKAIKRDMGARTSYSKYTQAAGLQDGLFGVCKAYALFDEGVGYAQGINFIAMPLLFNMSEEEAFSLLVKLMSKYDLRSMFIPDMPGLHLRLYHFERLLEESEPAVYCHLKRRHVAPQLYATQWFLTLFAYRFPLQLVLRIYDLILSEGLTAILKFGIAIMARNRQALLDMRDMSELTTFLKEKLFDVYIDKSPSASSLLDSGFFGSVTGGGADKELYRAEELVRDACSIQVSEDTLKAYTAEWEESQRTERQRETEIELLRTTNVSLTAKVRQLEDRVQEHDVEHVGIAQELVKIKIANDILNDQNEALQLQVTELQKMINTQPEEVEEKLKSEMDRIMRRNIEVQNENRAIKEEMDEMEHELVNAKVAHATTQSDYDMLQQKWSNVQALLNDKES